MYVYIYDTFVSEQKLQGAIARVETRLTDLGIAGKICRLSVLTSVDELVNDAIKNGAETIVAVGNDETVSKIISLVAGNAVSLGIIPLGKPNRLAKLLGIPEGEKACDILSARVIERIDLGKVNDQYFLTHLEIPSGTLVINNQYSVKALSSSQNVTIYNFGAAVSEDGKSVPKCDPRDGILEAIVTGSEKTGFNKLFNKGFTRDSVFPVSTAKIDSSDGQPVIADGQTVINAPIKIGVAKHRLKVVVGKNREF